MTSRNGSGRTGSGGFGTHDRILDGHLQRGGHRPRIGSVLSGDIESRTMVGGGPDDRQAERDVDRILEVERLDRDQRLVVIHAQRRIVIGARAVVEHRVGRVRPGHSPTLRRESGDRRSDDFELFPAELPTFTSVGVEPGHRESRLSDPKMPLKAAECRSAA